MRDHAAQGAAAAAANTAATFALAFGVPRDPSLALWPVTNLFADSRLGARAAHRGCGSGRSVAAMLPRPVDHFDSTRPAGDGSARVRLRRLMERVGVYGYSR